MASLKEGSVREDVVEYRLFIKYEDEHAGDQDVVRSLEEERDHVLAFLSRFCVNYVWHIDPFSLRIVLKTGAVPHHLGGITCFGDNVEDEWFIVSMLFQVSKEFQDVVISVRDTDGEFMLIEAADHLPRWLNPDTAENRMKLLLGPSLKKTNAACTSARSTRVICAFMTTKPSRWMVFVHRGKLHIVPRSFQASSVGDCVNYVRQNHSSTVAPNAVQESLSRRIAGYPQKSQELLHRTHCYIPASLAAALDHSPSLVAPIVQAFYLRDPLDLKACVTFKHFRPGTRVMRQVLFTRCLYAQLMQQKFSADRRSGYTLPPTNNPAYKAHELGMKLAHGAEILCSKYNIEDIAAYDSASSLHSDNRWQCFLSALKSRGYFKGELEGSKLYKALCNDAVKYYKSAVASRRSDDDDVGRRILGAIKSASFDMEEMRRQEKTLPPSDDDSWINISPEQLDEMLNNAYGKATSPVTDFNKVAERMKEFVDNMSSHEGAEFPGTDDDVQLDATGFIQTMQKMFEFDDPDSASSSDMDEYESEEELGDSYPTARPKHTGKSGNTTSAKPAPKPKPSGSAGKPSATSGAKKDGDVGSFLGMQDYMSAMDRELARTTIGKSFVQHTSSTMKEEKPKPPPRRRKPDLKSTLTPNNTPTMSSMPTMRNTASGPANLEENIDDEDDDFRPVNVDLNAVKNLLESYESQHGLPGPTSTILGGMGVRFPPTSGKR